MQQEEIKLDPNGDNKIDLSVHKNGIRNRQRELPSG
jgi:hypothetical protein